MTGLADSLMVLVPVGAFAGLLAGLFGIGGGVVTVVVLALVLPDLMTATDRVMHVALGTSLAAIVLTASASTLAHHRRRAVAWSVVLRFAPAVALGALIGGRVAHWIPDQALRYLFAFFLLWVALRLWRRAAAPPTAAMPGTAGLAAVGTSIGLLSAWTGIGGGSLTGPFLMSRGVRAANAVATSAAVGLPLALAGTAGYVWSGWQVVGLPVPSFGFVYWPAALVLGLAAMFVAPLGARLAHALPERALKTAYAVLLVVAALKLLTG